MLEMKRNGFDGYDEDHKPGFPKGKLEGELKGYDTNLMACDRCKLFFNKDDLFEFDGEYAGSEDVAIFCTHCSWVYSKTSKANRSH